MVGNLLEVFLPDFMIDEQDTGHNAEHLVQQVHLCDRVLLVPCKKRRNLKGLCHQMNRYFVHVLSVPTF